MPLIEQICINDVDDIVRTRTTVRQIATEIGFSVTDQTRLATAVSELARNLVQNAGTGFCDVHDDSVGNTLQMRLVLTDSGPGIPDVSLAMRDGYSSTGGMGAGLPGVRRLMDSFVVNTSPGNTSITAVMIRKKLQ